MAKKLLPLMLIMVCCLLTPFYCVGALLPDMPKTPTPERTLEKNDEYDVIWSLPNFQMESCKQKSLMTSIPGIIFVEKFSSLQAIDSLKGDTVWQIRPESGSGGVILVQGKTLYRATSGVAALEAYNTADGMLLWKRKLTGGHSADTLYVAENKIFVSTNDNEYFILNERGEILKHRSPVSTIYVEMDGILYFQNNAFHATDSASERGIWSIQADAPSYAFRSPPIFDAGTIFLRTADVDGFIYSINQYTGKVNWKVSQNMYSNLFAAGGKIYFISLDGYLISINRNSGAELSKVKLSAPYDFSDQDYCIIGDPTNNVLAVAFGDKHQLLGLKIKKP